MVLSFKIEMFGVENGSHSRQHMCCGFITQTFTDTESTADNERNRLTLQIPVSLVPEVLHAKAVALRRQEKQGFLVGVEEKFIFHILSQTQVLSFLHTLFLKSQQVCVCLHVTAVLCRGVTLGTMTPHRVVSVATTKPTAGSPCWTEWWLVLELTLNGQLHSLSQVCAKEKKERRQT